MEKPVPKPSWWARKSLFCRVLLILIPLLVVIGLAVGLGVGLTVGPNNSNESSGSSPTSSPLPPVPGNGTLWQPAVNSSWQIILEAPLELAADATSVTPNVSIYDIDLFDNDQNVMDALHRLGKRVICYFSAGSYEPDRPDSGEFKQSDKGKELDGWPGEYWLDLNSSNVRSVMTRRMDLAKQKGCDAIDPDNVDGYSNDNGLGLTMNDSINYVNFLATEARKRGLATGLKNAGGIILQVLPVVHFSVNEQCVEYSECTTFEPFIKDNKPVFHIEYPSDAPKIEAVVKNKYCSTSGDGAGSEDFSTVLKTMDLTGWVEYCSGMTASTALNSTS